MLDVKKNGITAAAILIFSCLSLGGDGVEVELGANYWFSTMVWEWQNLDEMEEDLAPDKAPGKTIGFQFKVSQGKAGLFGRYYLGSGFDWEEEMSFYDPYSGDNMSLLWGFYTDCTDLLIGASYDITPFLGVFAGYKSTKFEMQTKFEYVENIGGSIYTESLDEKGDIEGTGFGGGLTGEYWLTPEKLSVQFTGGYFPMDFDETESVTHYFYELGASCAINRSLELKVGYMYNKFDIEVDVSEVSDEMAFPDFIFKGFNVGAVFNFNLPG